MVKMYNTSVLTNITDEVNEYRKGNWINMVSPSEDEIKEVCENLNIQEDFIRYALDFEEKARIDMEEDDDTTLFIIDVPIIEKEKASIGMLQRMFKIGFNRAARIMDQLADAGVVGEEEGTKPRKVLMSMEQFENMMEEGY